MSEGFAHQPRVATCSSGPNLRPLIPILAACAALVFLCAGVGGAFMILAAIPFLGFWLLYSGYIIWRRHEKRRVQVIRVGILTATLAGIAALHFYYYTSARAAGDYAERLVSAYKAKHGTYPDTLEEAGWNLGAYGGAVANRLPRKWRKQRSHTHVSSDLGDLRYVRL